MNKLYHPGVAGQPAAQGAGLLEIATTKLYRKSMGSLVIPTNLLRFH
jgi:hypothetical protein